MTTEYTWYVIRATGIVAYVLLYLSVMLGLYSQVQKRRKKPLGNLLHLHESLSNWSCILVLSHLVFLFMDQYVSFGWMELLIPFATDYKPLSMAIGIFSLYLLLITIATTKLRKQIGIRLWRKLHAITPVMYILITIHGVLIGTDFQAIPILLLNLIPLAAFGWLLLKRYDTEYTA